MQIPKQAPMLFGAKRRGNVTTITLPNGAKRVATFLGRGKFSNVFEKDDRVYIFTQHGDLSKDILSHCEPDKYNPHIPLMYYLGDMYNKTIDVYRSKHYTTPVTKALAGPINWRHIKELQRTHAEAAGVFSGDLIANDQCIDFNYYIAEHANVPKKMKEALTCITESAQDWGKYYLFDDFRAKNLGLDSQNRVVFLDAMFDAALLQKQRTRR